MGKLDSERSFDGSIGHRIKRLIAALV